MQFFILSIKQNIHRLDKGTSAYSNIYGQMLPQVWLFLPAYQQISTELWALSTSFVICYKRDAGLWSFHTAIPFLTPKIMGMDQQQPNWPEFSFQVSVFSSRKWGSNSYSVTRTEQMVSTGKQAKNILRIHYVINYKKESLSSEVALPPLGLHIRDGSV